MPHNGCLSTQQNAERGRFKNLDRMCAVATAAANVFVIVVVVVIVVIVVVVVVIVTAAEIILS